MASNNRALTVSILKCNKVRGSRNPTSVLVRTDHGDTALKPSTKAEQVDGVVEVNHIVQLECPADLTPAMWLDRLVSQPLILSLLEVVSAGRDKRGGGGAGSKEEKTVMIGQSCVDLLEFLKAVNGAEPCSSSLTVPVHATGSESPLSGMTGSDVCTVDIELSVSSGFVGVLGESSRVLHACADALLLPPSQWSNGSNDITYAVGIPLPMAESKYRTAMFSGGVYRAANSAGSGGKSTGSENVPKHRRWNVTQPANATCAAMPSSTVSSVLLDEEDGELHQSSAALHLRSKAEKGPQVSWYAEGRSFVPESSVESFYGALRQQTLWPVEVMRVQTIAAAPTKGKRLSAAQELVTECQLSFHGVAFVELAPLLYPGCSKVCGVYQVHPYIESETLGKTGRKAHIAEILMQQHGGPGAERLKSAAQKKRTTSTSKLASAGEGGEAKTTASSECAAYTERGTYIKLEISLDRALIRRRPVQDIEEDISALLPSYALDGTRSAQASQGAGATAVAELRQKLEEMATLVKQALRTVICQRQERLEKESKVKKQGSIQPRSFQAILNEPSVRQALPDDLNRELMSSGLYARFQQQMCLVLVRVIRERFGHISAAKTEEELQKLLPQLHVFVAREVNRCLNEWSKTQSAEPPASPTLLSSAAYLLFAQEAEAEKHWKMASRYYYKCIELDRTPEHLFENAKFCINTGDHQVAFSNLKAAIALQLDHIRSLLLFAMLSAIHGHVEQAALFLEAAIEYNNPDFGCLPRVLLGLLHDMSGNMIARNHTFRDARRQARVIMDGSDRTGESSASSDKAPESMPRPLIDVTAASSRTTSTAMDKSGRAPPPPDGAILLASQTSIRSTASFGSQVSKAVGSQSSIGITPTKHSEAVTSRVRLGTPSHSQSAKPGANQEGTSDTDPLDDSIDTPWLFLDAAAFASGCHMPHFAALALHHHRTAHAVSQDYHIAMARLCLERGHYSAADESIQKALVFGYENAEVWAILGHARYVQGAVEAARACYERCIDLEHHASEEHIVYLRLGNIYLTLEKYDKAKKVFLLACQEGASAKAWLGVGKACFRLGSIQYAEAALLEANALNREEPEVWAYLSLISLKCNRPQPAERTFQYAMKTGLCDGPLAQELAALQAEKGFGDPAQVMKA